MAAIPSEIIRQPFERALEAISARVSVSGAGAHDDAADSDCIIAVAYSGGLDSTVLLHLAQSYASARDIPLRAFHVHHGLSPHADKWMHHCTRECERLGVPIDTRFLQLPATPGEGVEQAARHARYAALGALAREHGVRLLLTAHHQDDQAETVLLQLLRGAGVAGISGMQNVNKAGALLANGDLWMGRPLLELTRLQLEQWALQHELTWVEDESNADTRYTRNKLRHAVMPALAQGFPGYQQRLARAARHAAAAQELLDELGAADLQQCADVDGLNLESLRTLSTRRCGNLLRYWLAAHDVRMPSEAWLAQLQTQIFTAAADARVRVTHPDCEVWRYRGRVLLAMRVDDDAMQSVTPQHFRWHGEGDLSFPGYGGRLLFVPGAGIDTAWLAQQELVLHRRAGGERLKPAPNRPTRDLKHHYQCLGVPPWERRRLPLVSADGRLLYAAEIGLNWANAPMCQQGGIALRWIAGCD